MSELVGNLDSFVLFMRGFIFNTAYNYTYGVRFCERNSYLKFLIILQNGSFSAEK